MSFYTVLLSQCSFLFSAFTNDNETSENENDEQRLIETFQLAFTYITKKMWRNLIRDRTCV